ncbi:unnamed protein product [Malus baccata var. baccata]
MSGYPHLPPGSGYGSTLPGQPYGAPPQGQHQHQTAQPYDAPSSAPYGAPSSAPYGAPYAPDKPYKPDKPYNPDKPHKNQGGGGGYPAPALGYGSPFAALVPSVFPPGTDPNDSNGFIDDKEMQRALSSYNQSFSLRTVHLPMYLFTQTNTRNIVFERFDRDRSGFIDANELRDALLSLGFAVSPVVLELLVSKFDKTGGKTRAIEYDNFIECCLTVKGLTEKFKEKDKAYNGMGTFSYEEFMLTVLPFLIA